MNASTIQAASALNANMRWQEMISENLASSAIPGFRKQEMSFASVQSGLASPNSTGVFPSSIPSYMPTSKAATNFQNGEIKSTGIKSNVALEGSGFFQITLPNGAAGFTRAGNFQFNAQGEMVTSTGQPVMGENGPIQIDTNLPTPVSISATGEVSQGSESKGRLKVVDFNDPKLLRYIGGGNFLADNAGLTQITPANTTVRQECVESSNSSPTRDMVDLITSMRSFEMNQKVIQANDERTARLISEVGNPN
jgi:flagellar basal body rod protein FlgG